MRNITLLRIYAILNLMGYMGVVAVNSLANALPINGKTTGALSDQYPNLFTPAGFTFSIWGVIYILLVIYAIYQLRSAFKKQPGQFLSDIGILFLVSCLANMGWIFAWHYEQVGLSLVIMIILLACLLAIYLRLRVGESTAGKAVRYMVHLPFSVYLGWITVATIANVTALLVDLGWAGMGLPEQFWAVLVIAVAIAIALAMLVMRRDPFFALVADWAIFGILMKRLAVTGTPDLAVVVVSGIGLFLITLAIIIQLIRKKVY